MGRFLLLVALLGASACTHEGNYVYRPAEHATAILSGRQAARYGIPPESPRGSARVASFGIHEVNTPRGTAQALHVRLALANFNDTGPWDLDVRTLLVVYEDSYSVSPSFVNTNSSDSPVVSIPPRSTARIDAYFRLPPHVKGASGISQFDLLWEVHTPERTVAERTPFERMAIEPESESYREVGFGTGLGWWNNPAAFPWGPVIIVPRSPPAAPPKPGHDG